MDDEFLTLSGLSEGYFMDRGSKFLSYAYPVQSESQGQLTLQQIKKDHPKARHYCTAIRLFPEGSLERVNDDGEPSGSAGKPMLGQLIKNGLFNVMVVSVRYFGGTKLGVAGLIEAYRTSVANALEAATFIKQKVYTTYKLTMEYEQLPLLINHFKRTHIPVFETNFNESAILIIGFPKSTHQNDFIETLRQYSQHDFSTLNEYLKHLHLSVEISEDRIVDPEKN